MTHTKPPAIAGRIHCALLSVQPLLPTPSETDPQLRFGEGFGQFAHRRACAALVDRWASLTADAQALAAGEVA